MFQLCDVINLVLLIQTIKIIKNTFLKDAFYNNHEQQRRVFSFVDDLQYLQKNFVSITEEFLEIQKSPPTYSRTRRNVIKVMDRSTQTVKEEEVEYHKEYLEIKEKYEVVQQEVKKIKLFLKGGLKLNVISFQHFILLFVCVFCRC